jgi:hypothetical protein
LFRPMISSPASVTPFFQSGFSIRSNDAESDGADCHQIRRYVSKSGHPANLMIKHRSNHKARWSRQTPGRTIACPGQRLPSREARIRAEAPSAPLRENRLAHGEGYILELKSGLA